MYKKYSYELIDSNTDINFLIPFSSEIAEEGLDSADNMSHIDWENNPASIFHKLYIDKIFDHDNQGFYLVCLDEDKNIVGGAGCVRLHDSPYMITGYRGYNLKSYRNYGMMFPFHQRVTELAWDYIEKHYDGYLICFNQYNEELFNQYNRVADREPTSYKNNRPMWKNRLFLPAAAFSKLVQINYTPQWCLYGSYNSDQNKFKEYLSGLV